MARSASRVPVLAILGAVGLAVLHRLHLNAFVSPSSSFGSSGLRLQSRVILAASKAEIAEAEQQAKLLVWAAKTAAEQGAPQAATMQAKADQAVQALEALKQQQDGKAPPAPAVQPTPAAPAAEDTIQRTVMSAPVMVEEIAELERQVRLLKWAAETAAEKGMPQAGAAQARADEAVQQLVRLKEQQETHQGGRSVATPAVSAVPEAPAPAPAAAAPAAAASGSGASKAEIAEAEKHAKLLVWAAKTAAEQGAPQAATMQAKADQAVQALEALKQQQDDRAPRAAPSGGDAIQRTVMSGPETTEDIAEHQEEVIGEVQRCQKAAAAEIAEAEKRAKLLTWAANKAAEEGLPQAATMQAKADQAARDLAALKQQGQSSQPAPPPIKVVSTPPSFTSPRPPTREELEQAKKDMNLLVWAAKTAAEKGMPQAAMMQSKADVKKQEYESMVQRLEALGR